MPCFEFDTESVNTDKVDGTAHSDPKIALLDEIDRDGPCVSGTSDRVPKSGASSTAYFFDVYYYHQQIRFVVTFSSTRYTLLLAKEQPLEYHGSCSHPRRIEDAAASRTSRRHSSRDIFLGCSSNLR